MTNVKRQKRPYRLGRRALQATETREAVLSAANQLFVSIGWTKTTVAKIAAAASVSNETIYGAFGTKTALLQELVRRAVRGDRPDLHLTEQDRPRQIERETDQEKQIDMFAADITEVLFRVAPLMDAARAAAGTDPAIAKLYAQFHQGRRKNLEWFAAALLRNGPLRGGMNAQAAGAILWRLASPDLFLLMQQVELSPKQVYTDWLADSLKILLLA